MIEFSKKAHKELSDIYERSKSGNNHGKIISLNYYGRSYTTSLDGEVKELGPGMMMILMDSNQLSSVTNYNVSIGGDLFVSVGPKEIFDKKASNIDFNGEKFIVIFR